MMDFKQGQVSSIEHSWPQSQLALYLTMTKSLMVEEPSFSSNKWVYSQGLLLAGGQMT